MCEKGDSRNLFLREMKDMAEIRSTLDIIMEKTRDMTVTPEDRQAFLRQEWEGRIRGLLQKVSEGFLTPEALARELTDQDERNREVALETLRRECLERIDPDADNKPLLALMEGVLHMNCEGLIQDLERYGSSVEKVQSLARERLERQLKEEGIWGSAVLPNIQKDPEWNKEQEERRNSFRSRLPWAE